MEEVSRSVSSKGIEAPEAQSSFVAMDSERAGLVDENGLPLVYDKAAIQKYWEGQGSALQQRWIEFLGESVPFLTKVAGLLISGGTDALNSNAGELARDARVSIEKLGPTYVKMGQMMSVRPDVLPQEALNELQVLQDGVEGFDSSIAREMVEKELGRPIEEVFDEFGEDPAAAASLAQVYRARLRETGELVAVKVQRPGVQELVSKDLYVLRRAAEVYQGLVTRFAPQQRTDYVALLNEWAVGFYTELDFVNEASNMKKMATVLKEAGVTDVRVPKVYDGLTTRKMLISEWIDGRKLSECEPSEIKELIAIGQECFLVQLLQAGFFHSDPHPGNLMRPYDDSEGKLVLIDFGLVAQVEQEDMDAMVSSIVHLANKDYAALVDDFIRLQILPADCNRGKVIPLMDKALSPYVKGGGAKQYEQELKKMYGMQDGSMESTVGGFQAMTNDMLTVLNDIPFSIPPYFALLARAVVTLEGLALSADPSYGLVIEAYPFVARKLLSSDRPELQQALQEVLYAGTTPGGEGMRGVITPTRLAGLINSAAGIVAKQEGQAFVDLDAVPEDGISAGDALAYVLSPAAASLRTLLATEAENAADLLLRQALRKSVPLIAAAVPQPPRLPFLPAPPEPLELPLPLVLPSTPTSSLLSGAGGGVAGFPAALLAGTPTLTTGQQLLDALAPALSRDEELYAISLVDLARSSMGDATADLLAGDLAQDPRAAAAAAIPLLEALIAAAPTDGEAGASGDSSPALVQLARTTVQLLKSLPGVATAGAAAAAAGPAGEGAHEEGMHGALAKLDAQQRATMQHVLGDLGTSLVSKLDERLMAIR
jgi:aarF domain-containing kinase